MTKKAERHIPADVKAVAIALIVYYGCIVLLIIGIPTAILLVWLFS